MIATKHPRNVKYRFLFLEQFKNRVSASLVEWSEFVEEYRFDGIFCRVDVSVQVMVSPIHHPLECFILGAILINPTSKPLALQVQIKDARVDWLSDIMIILPLVLFEFIPLR